MTVERPLATVGGLILAADGDILLVRSHKWRDLYSLPGGKIEWGETREEAFRREVWEETSLKLVNIRFAIVQDCIFPPDFWQKRHFLMNDFIADLDPSCTKDQVVLNEEAYSYLWIPPEKALSLPLHTECRTLIVWLLSQQAKKAGLIGIEHHHVRCIIGVHPQERIEEQDLYFDVKMEVEMGTGALTDHAQDFVDYTQLAAVCTHLAKEKKYHLLETLATDILDHFIQHFNCRWVWIRIKKPAAIPTARYALVELEQRSKKWNGH